MFVLRDPELVEGLFSILAAVNRYEENHPFDRLKGYGKLSAIRSIAESPNTHAKLPTRS
jgi:hypothetical protein